MPSLNEISSPTIYASSERAGVAVVVTAGSVSIFAILICATRWNTRPKGRYYTHVFAYFLSLLIANALQATGAVMNARWVVSGQVSPGGFCGFQGGIKNAGNVGTALWSFMLALHIFNLLFLRLPTTTLGLVLTLLVGWTAVLFVPLIGATAIQTPQRGPYFGISGLWCWITSEYPAEQTFLEYFFEFLSAGLGFILYCAILLRIRGNLTFANGRWSLHFVPRCDRWKLALGRDALDSSMLQVAARMVWFPVAYSFILFPVSMSRLAEFAGRSVPMWAVMVSDVIFNSTGLVNVCLMFTAQRLLPDQSLLPEFTTPRKELDLSSPEANGVTPYTLFESRSAPELSDGASVQVPQRVVSRDTVSSVDSETPLNGRHGRPTHAPFSLRPFSLRPKGYF